MIAIEVKINFPEFIARELKINKFKGSENILSGMGFLFLIFFQK
jgi:hypothetical protein